MTEKPKTVGAAVGIPSSLSPQQTRPGMGPVAPAKPAGSVSFGPSRTVTTQTNPQANRPAPAVPAGPTPWRSGAAIGQRIPISAVNRAAAAAYQRNFRPDMAQGVFAGMEGVQRGPGVEYVPTYYSNDSVYGAWMTLKPNDRKMLERIKAGMPYGSQMTLEGVWSKGVQGAMAYADAGYALTPLQALQRMAQDGTLNDSAGGSDGSGGGGGGGGGGGSSAFQNVSYTVTNPETAERMVNAALTQFLGRQANPKEQKAFRRALNAFEAQNPSVTQGMTTSGGGMSRTTQTSSGGVDPTQFAEDWAMAQEGSAEYKASTEVMGWFLSALDNPMDVVT